MWAMNITKTPYTIKADGRKSTLELVGAALRDDLVPKMKTWKEWIASASEALKGSEY